MKKSLWLSLICLSLWVIGPQIAQAQVTGEEIGKAVEAIENLDGMRSGLASTLEGSKEEPTLETMKQVCKPVGMKAKQLSQENGWQVRQVASKYRNPAHRPQTPQEEKALESLEKNPQRIALWEKEQMNGVEGIHYYRRINVEASCLACHGVKEQRPTFVKEKYPEDLAYNFKVGDLRGMYSVFIPEVKEGLEKALN